MNFCTRTSAPNTGKPDLEFFGGRLIKEDLLRLGLALPQVARKVQTSCFRKEQEGAVKIVFLVLCENLFKTFPSLPNKKLLCLAVLQ